MIRTVTTKFVTLELSTSKGSYFLTKKMLGKVLREVKIPKSEIEYVKTCSDNELVCYMENKIIESLY